MSREVLESGIQDQCSFCGEVSASIELEELAEKIHEVIENYFVQTASEPEGYEYLLAKEGLWERPGEQVGDLICGIAVIEPEIGEAIWEYLSQQYDAAGKDALLEEQPYESDAQYAERQVDTYEFSESWMSFKRSIRAQYRFFNSHARDVLGRIFQGLGQLVTTDGEPVLHEISKNSSHDAIYRARVALSMSDLKGILRDLPKSLGGPPHKHAKSGRMNVSGISVFYGAMDVDTCIAEVHAPVGSYVVVGKFRPVRPIRILDLSRLQKIYVTGSYFESYR